MMWGDWLNLIGTVIVGVFSSFVVANLISIVTTPEEDQPASTLGNPNPDPVCQDVLTVVASRVGNGDSVLVKKSKELNSDENNASLHDGDGDIDWVDVGKTDLDKESSQVQASSDWVMF